MGAAEGTGVSKTGATVGWGVAAKEMVTGAAVGVEVSGVSVGSDVTCEGVAEGRATGAEAVGAEVTGAGVAGAGVTGASVVGDPKLISLGAKVGDSVCADEPMIQREILNKVIFIFL